MSAERRNIERLKAAVKAGRIRKLDQVWSPEDTASDTRYRVTTNTGEAVVLMHREVTGFLAGLEMRELLEEGER